MIGQAHLRGLQDRGPLVGGIRLPLRNLPRRAAAAHADAVFEAADVDARRVDGGRFHGPA